MRFKRCVHAIEYSKCEPHSSFRIHHSSFPLMAKDFYKILGVERTADEKEIKRAYRKLARQHHPDINPNDKGAEARFKEINEAFQVLSDKEKRPLYDQLGDNYDKVPAGMSAEDFARYSRGGNVSGGGSSSTGAGGFGYSSGGANLEDLFEQVRRQGGSGAGNAGGTDVFENLFGGRSNQNRGGFGFGGAGRRVPQKGGDVEQPIEISLSESIKGTQRSLRLTIQSEFGEETRNITVKIPAGVRENARVRVAHKGATGQNGGEPGDLFLKIHIAPHPFWKREGDDLTCEVPVTFGEAALGATIAVPTTESEVNLKIPAGTQSGQTFRLSGRGVHQKDGKAGDIFVKIKVAVPKNLDERERELVEELARLRHENVRQDLPKSL